MTLSDEQLMRRVQGGDVQALGELFDRHQPRLLAFLTRLLGDAATAEDLAQEAFWRAWEGRGAYDAGRPFAVWLYVIAKNAALNEMKKPCRRVLPFSGVETDPGADGGVSVSDLSLREQVRAALQGLPPDQRLCLVLREYEGWSYREAAQIIGCSEGAARVLAHRARRALRDLLRPLLECEDCRVA